VLALAVDTDGDALDQRGPDAGVVESNGRALWDDEGRDLDVRPDLGAVVSALKRGFVQTDDDRRHADDERGDGDEGLGFSVPGSVVGHVIFSRPMASAKSYTAREHYR
jgi:hypothetical protein